MKKNKTAKFNLSQNKKFDTQEARLETLMRVWLETTLNKEEPEEVFRRLGMLFRGSLLCFEMPVEEVREITEDWIASYQAKLTGTSYVCPDCQVEHKTNVHNEKVN